MSTTDSRSAREVRRRSTLLQAYLCDVEQFPLLTVEEERALAWRKWRGDQAAARRLTECNLRLVLAIAYKYVPLVPEHAIMDLIQEGNLGLMVAVNAFDPAQGRRFSTLAYLAITQRVISYARGSQLPVSLPSIPRQDLAVVKQAVRRFTQTQGRMPTVDELVESTRLPRERVENIFLWTHVSCVSLDEPLGVFDERTYPEIIADSHDDLTEIENVLDIHTLLDGLLPVLKPAQRDVVERYYGLNGQQACQNFRPIADSYHVTLQRVQQIHTQALISLRQQLTQVVATLPREERCILAGGRS